MSSFTSSIEIEESETIDICAIYAEQAGQAAIEAGSNYWSAVFHAYAYCIDVVGIQ